jgi:hypothetical protein
VLNIFGGSRVHMVRFRVRMRAKRTLINRAKRIVRTELKPIPGRTTRKVSHRAQHAPSNPRNPTHRHLDQATDIGAPRSGSPKGKPLYLPDSLLSSSRAISVSQFVGRFVLLYSEGRRGQAPLPQTQQEREAAHSFLGRMRGEAGPCPGRSITTAPSLSTRHSPKPAPRCPRRDSHPWPSPTRGRTIWIVWREPPGVATRRLDYLMSHEAGWVPPCPP